MLRQFTASTRFHLNKLHSFPLTVRKHSLLGVSRIQRCRHRMWQARKWSKKDQKKRCFLVIFPSASGALLLANLSGSHNPSILEGVSSHLLPQSRDDVVVADNTLTPRKEQIEKLPRISWFRLAWRSPQLFLIFSPIGLLAPLAYLSKRFRTFWFKALTWALQCAGPTFI